MGGPLHKILREKIKNIKKGDDITRNDGIF